MSQENNLAYNIWRDDHYDNLDSLLDRLEALNINTVFVVNGIRLTSPDNLTGFRHRVPPPVIWDTIHTAKDRGFKVWLKPHVHSLDAYGNEPNWWQGFVGLNFTETERNHFFDFLYPQECLEPVFHCQNMLDGLVLGTELASLANAFEWVTYAEVLKRCVPGTYQDEHFKITYAHNSWQPILFDKYRLIKFMKSWLGTESVIDRVLSGQPDWKIIDSYKEPLGEAILEGGGKISCFDELDYAGLDCYPYWTFDPHYSSLKIEKLLRDYVFKSKFLFWTLRYHIDYYKAINDWRGAKELIITECSTMGDHSVKNNLDFQVRWWTVILRTFEHARLIGIWDDGLVLNAIENIGLV